MQRWSKPLSRCTRPIRRAKPGCSRPASTAIGSSSRQVTSNSATSWLCSTPLRCRACLPRRYKLPALVCVLAANWTRLIRTAPMPSQNRMMTLVAFLQAQNCSNLPGSWRHPSTMPDFLMPEYYQRIARTLEDGKIQMAFFDDRLALPDLYTGHHAEAVGAGVRAVKMDPATILMTMGMVTHRLGLGVTYSTTYYEPFHVARLFATMDLMLKGRPRGTS